MTDPFEGWLPLIVLIFGLILGDAVTAAPPPPATMMVFNQHDKSLKGVMRWDHMGECLMVRKYIEDFLWTIGSSGKYYVTCTPQPVD
jgi:hypothetical protein